MGVGSSFEPSSEILSKLKVKSKNIDRSANVVFFGLPEDSLIKTREIVDEISNFLLDSVVGVKDLFRVGKRTNNANTHSRPKIVKFSTLYGTKDFLLLRQS